MSHPETPPAPESAVRCLDRARSLLALAADLLRETGDPDAVSEVEALAEVCGWWIGSVRLREPRAKRVGRRA